MQLASEHGPFQPSLFDERNLIELTSEHFPGERLVARRNPALAEERSRKRMELLAATEADLAKVAAATQRPRAPLRGEHQKQAANESFPIHKFTHRRKPPMGHSIVTNVTLENRE